MLRKDLRSLILSLVIGDGCLHYLERNEGNNKKLYGSLTIGHGIAQADYMAWKANLLSEITGRKVKVRTTHNGKTVQISCCMKRFRVWRKFCYPNGKKDISRILPFITNPYMCIAIWLMDDGYVETSISKLANGKKKNYSASLRIFTCDETIENHEYMIKWFKDNFGANLKIKYQNSKKENKSYPFLKINCQDSLNIWHVIRDFVLQFKSMRYKFRYIEEIYQERLQSAHHLSQLENK